MGILGGDDVKKIIYIVLAIIYISICVLSVFVVPPVADQAFKILPVALRVACWIIGIIIIVLRIVEENKK